MISLHGGPEAQERPAFNPQHQAMTQAGITVLAPNIRGSSGFGRAFVHADDVHGRLDAFDDVLACRDFLVDSGLADPGRIAVTGRSYGGTSRSRRWPSRQACSPRVSTSAGCRTSRRSSATPSLGSPPPRSASTATRNATRRCSRPSHHCTPPPISTFHCWSSTASSTATCHGRGAADRGSPAPVGSAGRISATRRRGP